jgi:hypothetical protein
MDKKKRLVFNYFDMIYSGYKKHGRRPVTMSSPNVLFEYKNEDGNVVFEFNTQTESIRFDYNDFNTAKNMLGIFYPELSDICKEYVANKFDEPSALKSAFFARTLK